MSATTIIVNDVEPRRQYTATSGQTVFDFPIPFFSDEDLKVYLTPAGQQSSDTADLLTLTTDYSVTGADTQDSGVVTLVTGASTGDIITIERVVSIARTADYQTSGDLLAETVNREQDTEIFISQQLRAGINRSFRLPITDTSGASLVLPSPAANYVIGWNSDGDAIINFQEIGQYQGTDATVTTSSYSVRDLVKSTTAGQLDNVYICTQASPAGTSLTNTSYWALIIDAVSAATSASNAATSASAAATSASNAATSETNAATSETNAANSATSASTSATSATNSASTASTAASNAATSESNASTSETNAAASATSASSSASSAASSATSAAGSATTATTKASEASTSASNASTSETNAANSASSASTSATNAATSESNAAASAASAEAVYDNFDDRYLGAKASDPALDNDGAALLTGALYWNSTNNVIRVYNGSAWGDLPLTDLSSLTDTSFSSLASGEGLLYDGTNWVNEPIGRKNYIINGNFDIWQRGTSFTAVAAEYTADRWVDDDSNGAKTATRQAFTLGQTVVAGNPKYYYRHNRTSAATGANRPIQQRIEGVDTLSGEDITISFYAKANTSKNFNIQLLQNFGTGGSPSTTVFDTPKSFSVTTSWQKFEINITVPSVSGKTLGSNGDDYLSMAILENSGYSTFTLDIAQVQLEKGSVATDFEYRPIAEELALCQRYFQKFGLGHSGFNASTTQVRMTGEFIVQMRDTPTLSLNDTSVSLNAPGLKTSTGSIINTTAVNNSGATYFINGFTGISAADPAISRQDYGDADAEF